MAPPIKGNKISRSDALKKIYSTRIKKAYETSDHLDLIADKQLVNRFDGYSLKLLPSKELDGQTFQWIIDLIQSNMESLFNSCVWRWNRSQKEKEIKNSKAMILIVYNLKDNQPVGFTHFRFDYDEDNARGVIYCYELQIDSNYQGKGLGSWLMDLLYGLSVTFDFPKLMLTCLKHNQQAMNFYRNKCGYMIDPRSPSKFGENVCYEILSLKVNLNS